MSSKINLANTSLKCFEKCSRASFSYTSSFRAYDQDSALDLSMKTRYFDDGTSKLGTPSNARTQGMQTFHGETDSGPVPDFPLDHSKKPRIFAGGASNKFLQIDVAIRTEPSFRTKTQTRSGNKPFEAVHCLDASTSINSHDKRDSQALGHQPRQMRVDNALRVSVSRTCTILFMF